MKSLFPFLLIFAGIHLSPQGTSRDIAIKWTAIHEKFGFAPKQSIACEAWCYEWAGTDQFVVKREGAGKLFCYTVMNAATHCSLELTLNKDSCSAQIALKSIVPGGDKTYTLSQGSIEIDQILFQRGILKSKFDFRFFNPENEKPIFWKGKIYARIK